LTVLAVAGCGNGDVNTAQAPLDPVLVAQARRSFAPTPLATSLLDRRFGHESGDCLCVDRTTALSVGLKVMQSAAGRRVQGIQDAASALTSPATTVALLKLNAVSD